MAVDRRNCHRCLLARLDISHFSPSQREVVQAGDGPLSILAGPGSGKTTVLAGRIAYLVVERNVPPSSILAITFTTAAAATLREAAAGLGLELAPEPGARDADPWAAPLASLAAAVERFRLAGPETTVSPHDPDGVDQELVRPLSAAYDALLQQRGAIDYASKA